MVQIVDIKNEVFMLLKKIVIIFVLLSPLSLYADYSIDSNKDGVLDVWVEELSQEGYIVLTDTNHDGNVDSKQMLDERIFISGKANPIVLNQDSSELRLLVNIRDEAHRFALAYHKKLRKQQYYESPLDKIPGIGQAKKKNLVKHFGDIQKIRNASLDELCKVKGINPKDAKAIYIHLS